MENRWILLKRPERLRPDERSWLAALEKLNPPVYCAYLLRESFLDVLEAENGAEAHQGVDPLPRLRLPLPASSLRTPGPHLSRDKAHAAATVFPEPSTLTAPICGRSPSRLGGTPLFYTREQRLCHV